MPLVPIDFSDLTVEVDDDIYARLLAKGAVYDPASGKTEDEFNRTRRYHVVVRAGHPYLVNVHDKFDAKALKNWIMSPPAGQQVYVNKGNRRALRRENLSVVPQEEGHQFRLDHPAPSDPIVTDRGFTWVPELQGFVPDRFTRRSPKKEHHKTKPKIRWKAQRVVPCFSSPDAGLVYDEKRREAALERVRARQQGDEPVDLPPNTPPGEADETDAPEDTPADAFYAFVPLAARLSGIGRSWGRQGQTNFLVMIGLQYYCMKRGQLTLLADHHSIGAKLGVSYKAVQRAIDHMDSTQAIKKTPRRSDSVTQDKGRHFRKNLPPECTFPDEPDDNQPHGRFPTRLFDDSMFRGLETLHKAVLAALYLMALGTSQAKGAVSELQAHASVAKSESIRKALATLKGSGFLTDYEVAADGTFRVSIAIVV